MDYPLNYSQLQDFKKDCQREIFRNNRNIKAPQRGPIYTVKRIEK